MYLHNCIRNVMLSVQHPEEKARAFINFVRCDEFSDFGNKILNFFLPKA